MGLPGRRTGLGILCGLTRERIRWNLADTLFIIRGKLWSHREDLANSKILGSSLDALPDQKVDRSIGRSLRQSRLDNL